MSAPLTVEQLLAAHPWPTEFASEPRLEWLWHFEVPVSLEQLWPLIADSSRMNRALGVAEMKFVDRGNVRVGTCRQGGLAHEWVEVPWNWVAGQWLESVRIYDKGFSKVVFGVFVLTPLSEEQTRVSVYFGAIPRNFFGKAALSIGFPGLEKDFTRVFAEVADQLRALKGVFVLPGPPALSPEAETKLTRIRTTLLEHQLDVNAVDQLISWIRRGDEEDLYRIQIRERARAWQVDEHQLLRIALHATREGLLQISWDLICPHCRGVTSEVKGPDGLTAKGECGACEISFATSAAESVEITFHVHPSIRDVAHRTFCSAEPATKQHVRLQRDLKPGESLHLTPRLAPGSYRLRLHGKEEYGFLDVGEGRPAQVEWKATALGRHEASLTPTLSLLNDTATPQRFVLEAARWSDHALRPGQLFSLQEYRDLFSEDYLATDVQLAIGEQTILFTDIVGSTAMYAARGDPAAFMEVKRHFEEIFPIVARHRGAVVKTIGDAIMAAFSDPLDAVKACADIHACFHAERADSTTRLRISLNTGPCIAVKLNTGVDYFGQTVNLAAKLQSLAEAGEVALSHSVWNARGVQAWLDGRRLESLAYESKALAAPVPVTRWACFAK
jgi:class 3 adenylate cyclase